MFQQVQQTLTISPKRQASYSPVIQQRRSRVYINETKKNSINIIQPTLVPNNFGQKMYLIDNTQEQYPSSNQQYTNQYPLSNYNKQDPCFRKSSTPMKKNSMNEKMYTVHKENEMDPKDREIQILRKELDQEIQEKQKCRQLLEQKTNILLAKEKEITKLLAVIHQIQKGEQKTNNKQNVSELQNQIEALEKYIKVMTQTIQKEKQNEAETKMQVPEKASQNSSVMLAQLQSENEELKYIIENQEQEKNNFLKEMQKLQDYLENLTKINSQLQTRFQEKCLELRKYQMIYQEKEFLEKDLSVKNQEIKDLKEQLNKKTLNTENTLQNNESSFDQCQDQTIQDHFTNKTFDLYLKGLQKQQQQLFQQQSEITNYRRVKAAYEAEERPWVEANDQEAHQTLMNECAQIQRMYSFQSQDMNSK